MSLMKDRFPVTALDYRRLAQQRLPHFLFDYLDGGANEEWTQAANVTDFQKIRIKQRVLRDVSSIDTSTTLMGEHARMPLILGPVGLAGLMARRGEVQAVRAAQAAGVPFTHSTVGICPVDEVRAATVKPFWFQLYMLRDRGVVRAVLERARAAGCTTLVFTVDLPVAGLRHRDQRNGLLDRGSAGRLAKAWQIALRPRWALDVGLQGRPHHFGSLDGLVSTPTDLNAFKTWLDGQFDASVTWKDIAWLRELWKGKLLLKGLLEADDAKPAVEVGVEGIIVSNHGGRQLDSVASTISKLPGMVQAVGGRVEVYLDGGVRSGIDVFKAVALGARGVLLGRAWAWALAGAGAPGLSNLLTTMRRELEVAMALSGVNTLAEITCDQVDVTGLR